MPAKLEAKKHPRITHKRINQILALLVISVGLYLVLTPAVPKIEYQLRASPQASSQTIPKENRVVVPSAKIDSEIVEGPDISVIDNGNVWRRPATSNDPSKGNMVIVGHNYTYKDPTPPLYSLGEANIGDNIKLFWEGSLHEYKVVGKKIVSPSAVEVEAPTDKPTLTLYTCYPLFIANQRMVLKAEKI